MLKIELSADGKRATGVTYVNTAGETFFQPAEMVILSAYVLQNVPAASVVGDRQAL